MFVSSQKHPMPVALSSHLKFYHNQVGLERQFFHYFKVGLFKLICFQDLSW